MRELSLHILDVLENSVEAGATRVDLSIEECVREDRLTITVSDNGRGMTEEFAQQVLNPFVTTRTTRHVGLGLPLFAAAARRCNGELRIQSVLGVGTTVTATFQLSHIDRAPLGDIASSLMAVILSDRPVDVSYQHRVLASTERSAGDKLNGREFGLDTAEVRRELGDVPLSHPLVRQWLESALSEGLTDLKRPFP